MTTGRSFRSGLAVPAIFIALLAFPGCSKFEVNPYATHGTETPQPLNSANLAWLAAREPFDDDTVTIVFTGDCQRFYEEQEAIVAKVNSIPGVDFLIMAGDLSDFGLLQEYNWVRERMDQLHVPWFAVVGNHDLQANGPLIFRDLFGPLNFSFSYKGYKFLFHDTNGREYANNGSVPDLPWLAAQMADTVPDHFIAVSHVPPFNGDFDPVLVQPYYQLLGSDPRTLLSLHGHTGSHVDEHLNNDHVRYMVCNALVWPVIHVLRIHDGLVEVTAVNYRE